MESVRKLTRKTWISWVILGTFVLWSGMAVCMLPNPPARLVHDMTHALHSDCLGGKAPTFCKSDARLGLSNVQPFALLDSNLLYRAASMVDFSTTRLDLPERPHFRFIHIFLLVCAFLK